MKQVGEEQQELASELNDRAVVDYLLQHPEFFIRNAALVEHMSVPHPVRGSVSLVEWHMARARNHINVLEENMALLMEQANANESLFYRLLSLQGRLVSASSLDDMLMRFHRWARELGLAGATVRLFPDRWRLGAPSKFTHLALSRQAFEPLRIQRLGQSQHYLGPLNGPELLVMMPEAKAIGSVAMSMLGQDGSLGVMLFSSRDVNHYQQGQGTQLLQEISLMLPELLERAAAESPPPVCTLFARCRTLLDELGERSMAELWREALEQVPLGLDGPGRLALEELGEVLGRYDGDGQREALAHTRAELSRALEQAREAREKQGRMYQVLGITAGAFLVILLL